MKEEEFARWRTIDSDQKKRTGRAKSWSGAIAGRILMFTSLTLYKGHTMETMVRDELEKYI